MWINTIFTVPRNLLALNVSTGYKNAGLWACKSSMFKGWDNKFCSALQAMCKEYIWPPHDEKINPVQAAVRIKNQGQIYLYQFDIKKENVTADSRPKTTSPWLWEYVKFSAMHRTARSTNTVHLSPKQFLLICGSRSWGFSTHSAGVANLIGLQSNLEN